MDVNLKSGLLYLHKFSYLYPVFLFQMEQKFEFLVEKDLVTLNQKSFLTKVLVEKSESQTYCSKIFFK